MTHSKETQPWPRAAVVGDTIICGVRNPYPSTIAMKLETPAAVAYANKLIASKKSGWRLVELPTPRQMAHE